MHDRIRRTGLVALGLLASFTTAAAGDIRWAKHAINAQSIFEAAAAIDVDGDGDRDVVCGDTWYEAPGWARHKIRDVEKVGTYMNCFSTLPLDADGDGDTDFISVSYFGKNVGWVENPGKKDAPWTYHEIDVPGSSECAVMLDLTGDGRPEIIPNTVNVVVFYEHVGTTPAPEFRKYDFSTELAGHGVGTGDINNDGRVDLLTPKGWYEAPAEPTSQTWIAHPEWDLGAAGIQILARDVNGDGLSDLVHGMGHARGLYWMPRVKAADGSLSWGEKQVIDGQLTSVHTLLWADLDGDGNDRELVTGKRVYAHEKEEGDTEASVIAYYTFEGSAGAWTRHVIFQGEPAVNAPADPGQRDAQKDFPAGTAGVGLQLDAVDLDADGDLDLVCPGKSGLYWFENRGTSAP